MKLRTLGAAFLLAILGLAIGCDPAPRFMPGFLRGEKESVVLGSYNIHIGKGTDAVLDLKRIATLLADAKVDVAGLQEVDRLTQTVNRGRDLVRQPQTAPVNRVHHEKDQQGAHAVEAETLPHLR